MQQLWGKIGALLLTLALAGVLGVSAQTTPTPTLPPPAITPLRLSSPTPTPTGATGFAPALTPPAPLFPLTLAPLAPSAAPAESVFPIRPGTIEGALNPAVPRVRYRFDARSGDAVTLRMETTSGTLDPVLSLLDSGGALVARNDDLASGIRDAEITLTVETTGAYIVEASGLGEAAGTFRLTLAVAGVDLAVTPSDPRSQPPPFAVSYTIIDYQDFTPGTYSADALTPTYYAIAGRQGDLVRAILTRTGGEYGPALRILDADGQAISRETGTSADEAIAFATLPGDGWYLIEAAGSGAGSYELYVSRIAATELGIGRITASFLPNAPATSYLISGARLGDLLTFNMFMTDQTGAARPEIVLYDLSRRELGRASGERFATLRVIAPRSAPYILEANNAVPGTFGTYSLNFSLVPEEIDDLAPLPARYNEVYTGTIATETPQVYYRFSGKTGELVTLTLTAADGDLDPYLILLDGDRNELALNNDAGGTRDARIVQFRLPKDGDYLIVAGRFGLALGATSGGYELAITAGAIALESGALTATLSWSGVSDLNLFVIDPSGQPVSWSAPESLSGGRLQIDANTGCETLSAEPVEHIRWSQIAPGDYQIWVWAQNGCGAGEAVVTPFSLAIAANGTPIRELDGTLEIGQRYQTSLRLTGDGTGVMLDDGSFTRPTSQQQASEGGDPVITFGTPLTGTITSDRYALFYQFSGTAGDVVTIQARRLTGDLDPLITLLDALNRPLADNDDARPDTRDSLLTYTLPADGRYVIAVTRYGVRDGTTAGDFQLSVERTAAP